MPSYQKTVIVTPTYYGYPHSIQDGIRKLNGQPGTIIVESGNYDILSLADAIHIPDNTSIIGTGNVNVNLKTPLSTALVSNSGFNNIILSGINFILCEEVGLYLENLIFFQNTTNSIIDRVNVTAQRIELAQQGGVAILLYARDTFSKNNMISNCSVTNYGGIGFYLTTCPTPTFPMPDICSNNVVRDCYTNKVALGLGIVRASHNSILNNTFIDSTGDRTLPHHDPLNKGHDGIAVYGNYNRIIGNDVSHNSEHGIYLSGCRNGVIQNNICNGNYSVGIHVRYADELGNIIDDRDNVISGNVCNDNGLDNAEGGCGIQMQEYANHNIVTNNICKNNKGDGLRVHLIGATGNIVSNNLCYENQDNQISIETLGNLVTDNFYEGILYSN